MPTKDELEQLIEVAEKKITRQEKQIARLKKSDSDHSLIYRLGIGLPLIIGSRWIPDTAIKTNWFSGDLLVITGICFLLLPTLMTIYAGIKKKK